MKKYIIMTRLSLLLLAIGMSIGTSGQSAPDSILSKKIEQGRNIQAQLKEVQSLIPIKSKKQDTVFVLVNNITFADPNLDLLKAAISKGKDNVKSLLQEGTVILKVIGKKDAGAIYSALDASLKKMFEPSDIGDARMILNYKSQLPK